MEATGLINGSNREVYLMKKFNVKPLLFLIVASCSSYATASDFGCQALLCFAGGKNVSECQPTIKKVLKDMAKGKVFPHCGFAGANGSANGSSDNMVSTRMFNERWPRPICRDGQTRAARVFNGYQCKTIEIKVDPKFAADPLHQVQYFNY